MKRSLGERGRGRPARRHLGIAALLLHRHHRPFELSGGHLEVPAGPGLGVEPIPEALDAVTTSTEWITL